MKNHPVSININNLIDNVTFVGVGADLATEEVELKVKKALGRAIDSAISMKNQIYLHHTGSLNELIQALANAQLLQKYEVIQLPAPCQGSEMQHNEPTNLNSQTYLVQQVEGKKLFCPVCGLPIPTMPQGEIDTEQLAHEISSQKSKQTCPKCLRKLNTEEA
ncbi:MAG: hypothetical protein Q8O72_10450 [Bacteroidales bacterium]|nr:hypothetical protein [Bacteroidales bacterium]